MNAQAAARATTPGAPDAGWIRALDFTPRKESWVAAAGDSFYKIFRRGGDPAADWLDPACIEAARHEYCDMRLLHRIDPRACAPLRLDRGCVVYPRLAGPDLHALLLDRDADAGRCRAALHEAVMLLARLHGSPQAVAGCPRKNYLADAWLRPGPEVLRHLDACPRTACIEGFEVRNFRHDPRRAAWLFFDPQGVSRGVAENDLARFVISLLMVNWGTGVTPRLWTGFDARALVEAYDSAAVRPADPVLLRYFLRETVAMRRHFANRALRSLRGAARIFGRPYLAAYFHQLGTWTSTHGL